MKKVNIAFIIDHLDVGGTETQLYLLLKNLDRHVFQPIVFCLKEKGVVADKIENLGIEVILININYRFIPKLMNRCAMVLSLAAQMKKREITVVQSYLLTANIFGSIAARMAGVKVVCASERSIRNTDNLDLKGRSKVFRIVSIFIDKVSGNSSMVMDYLQHKVKIPKRKLTCISNGVPKPEHRFNKKQIKQNLGYTPDIKLIGIVGRLMEQKNHQMLIEAVKHLKSDMGETRILIIGDGPMRGILETIVAQEHLSDKIIFLGNRLDIDWLLTGLDLLVQTSNFEGLPNVIMEAMSAGLPVIATDAGGTNELVTHQENGYLIPCNDIEQLRYHLEAFIENPKAFEHMGSKGKASIEKHFSIDQLVNQSQRLYLDLLTAKA